MKRIVILTPSLYGGGAERVSCVLANNFSDKNEVTIFHISGGSSSSYELNEEVIVKKIVSIYSLAKDLNSINPDVIIVMFAPMIIKIFPAILISGRRAVKLVSERNDPENFSGKKATAFLYQNIMRIFDGVVFQTRDVLEWYLKKRKAFKNSQIIYNPIDSNNLPIPIMKSRKKQIVSVGRLESQKNHKLLIKAFNNIKDNYPDYDLVIYGEGSLRKQLEKLIQDLGISNRVFLPGNKKNVLQLINGSSLFVLSSDYEGMSNALIEALALGLPTIATDCPVGGSRELITNLKNGILVPVNDAESLTSAMDLVLGNKIDVSVIANNALQIRHDLCIEKVAKKWLDFIESIEERKE